jgi:hypothetical protein
LALATIASHAAVEPAVVALVALPLAAVVAVAADGAAVVWVAPELALLLLPQAVATVANAAISVKLLVMRREPGRILIGEPPFGWSASATKPRDAFGT